MSVSLAACSVRGPSKPYHRAPLGTACMFTLTAAVTLIWADGYTSTVPAGTQATVVTSGAATFDQTSGDWLVVAQEGVASLTLVPLSQLGNLATLFTAANYCPIWWCRWDGVSPWPFSSPSSGGSGMPSPAVKGDIPYYDGSAWVLLHIPSS